MQRKLLSEGLGRELHTNSFLSFLRSRACGSADPSFAPRNARGKPRSCSFAPFAKRWLQTPTFAKVARTALPQTSRRLRFATEPSAEAAQNGAMSMDGDIERVLWTAEEIAVRISELGTQISDDFRRFSPPVIVVGVATGAFIFLADIVRQITLPIAVDFIRAESYGSGTKSNGAPIISCDLKLDISGKHVILVEDIVDTGATLSCLISHLKSKGACSVSVCTLLEKPARRKVHFDLVGEGKFYYGFECPDEFVVGYGLDLAEIYRNLSYIGVLKPEKYT